MQVQYFELTTIEVQKVSYFTCEANYLLNTIKCIYRNTKVRIKFNGGISEPIHINKGVRQGCGLSPVLFNTYINKIIQEFKTVIKKGIQLNNRKLGNTILYYMQMTRF